MMELAIFQIKSFLNCLTFKKKYDIIYIVRTKDNYK